MKPPHSDEGLTTAPAPDDAPANAQTHDIAPAPRAGRKRSYHHGDLADALAAAARVIIERDGPANLSLSKCCRMAGVSTAAPYKHFSGKDELLRRLVMDGFEELGARMREARDDCPGPLADRITAMGMSYIEFALANPGMFRLVFGMTKEMHDPQDLEMEDCGQSCFQVLIDEAARAVPPDAGEEAAKGLAIMLWTFVHGAASLALDGNYDAAKKDVDLRRMVAMATASLLPA
ncbi:MAG: TetR/AcrR family transcriptional regulator [Pseudomonadota bacterium]